MINMHNIKKPLFLLLILLGAVVLSGAVSAADNDNITANELQINSSFSNTQLPDAVISGEVDRCSNGEPFPGVTVSVDADGAQIASTTTQEDGTYLLTFPSTNQLLQVTASCTGHNPVTKELILRENTKTAVINFQLGMDEVYISTTGNDTTGDGTIGNPYASLSKGILETNPNGTLHVATGTYTGALNVGITIDKNISIIGDDQATTIIDAEGNDRIFTIETGYTVNIQNLTLQNGNSDVGGAIYNSGTLNITNTILTGNKTTMMGGAIYNYHWPAEDTITANITGCTFNSNTSNGSDSGSGGAIENFNSIVIISGCTFTGNTAMMGGAIDQDSTAITISGCTFTGNSAVFGGAISSTSQVNDSTATISNCIFNSNNTSAFGGAIYSIGDVVTISGSTFTGNTTTQEGGAIYNRPFISGKGGILTISGSTFTGNTGYNGGAIRNFDGTATISNSIFTNNTAGQNGGAIDNYTTATISDSTFIGNTAEYGGAINNNGDLTVDTGCSFTSNTAEYGGAICNKSYYTVIISDSIFTSNTAEYGGAIYNEQCTATISNSIFKTNSATYGGAIDNYHGTATLTGCTFTGNSATYGGAIENMGGTANITGTLFETNIATSGGAIENYNGTANITSSNFNVNSAASGGAIYNGGPQGSILSVSIGCTFTRNTANNGGAITNDIDTRGITMSTATISNSSFTENSASGGSWISSGGAIINAGIITISNSSLTGNSATNGGAIENGGTATITDSIFTENSATNGGAIYNNDGSATISYSSFTGNSATNGGAIYNNDGSATISYSSFTGNSATNGGAIYNNDGSATISYSSFTGNSATNGGAIYNNDGSATISYSSFTGNSATNGGAVYNYSYERCTADISCSTFTFNTASINGGAIYNYGELWHPIITIHFNRIVNNIANGVDNAIYTNDAVDAINNWWGSNDNPSGLFTGTGTFNYSPWIILNATATPSSITTGGTSVIAADLTFNSDGHDTTLLYPGQYVPDGISALFVSDSLGSFGGLSSVTVNTVNGKATTIFSPFTTTGVSTINVSVDNALNIPTTVTITSGPIVNTRTTKTYDTIKAAIESIDTINGDTINVGSGTYSGSLNVGITIDKNISIIGADEATTIIDAVGQNNNIFTIETGYAVNITNLTFQNVFNMGLGGAIFNNGILNLSDCNFFNNISENSENSMIGAYGGAIFNSNDATATISDSTFLGNKALNPDWDPEDTWSIPGKGGAIYNEGVLIVNNSLFEYNNSQCGGAICTGNRSATITGSTFTGNSATYGGAIDIIGFDEGCTADISSSIFTFNTASIKGGAIYYNYGGLGGHPIITIHFNRIVNNTISGLDNAIDTNSEVDAINNWWGSNDNPSGLFMGTGTVTYSPWIILNATATPSSITTGGTSVITADLTFNSDDQDTTLLYPGQYVPDGISALFVSDSLGSFGGLSSVTVNTVNGNATTIFSPFTSTGVSTINVSVDDALNIPTTVTIIIGPVVNTRTTKDYVTIQAAIDSIDTINGDTLNVATGTYDENLLVNKLLNLQALGTVTVQAVNTGQPVILITTGGSGSTINGFTFTNGWAGICLDGSTGNTITNNTLTGNQEGINIANSSNTNTISSNNIHDNTGFGVNLNSSAGNTVSSNTVSANGVMGVFIQNSNNNRISGNTIQTNGWTGICLDNASHNIIDVNEVSGNGEGLLLTNASSINNIQGNNIHHNYGGGINLLGISNNNQIISNTAISNNGVMGVFIQNSNGNNVSGNTIHDNIWAGICLDNAMGNMINGSNNISGNQEGINITNNSTGNTINGNNIHDNTNIGISVINSSTRNNIISNTISHNGVIGIYLRESSTNTISGNTIQINSWTGICFDQSTGNTINSNNNISGNLEGLYIVNNSNGNSITANNIHENADTGIYIDGSTGNNIYGANTISNNGVIGILLRGANTNTISGNTIAGNTFSGIALDNADSNNINGANTISGSQMGIYIVNASNSNKINNNTLQNNTWAGIVLDNATNTIVYYNNFTNNPLQALSQNGTSNTFYQGTIGNYWSDWPSTDPRPIYGNENLYDEHPSTTPF